MRTDTLHESVAAALTHPRVLAGALLQLARNGRAALKRHLASGVNIDVNLLPVNEEVIALVRSEYANGRRVFLATGADSSIADRVVLRFPEFEGSFASDGTTNLTSERKAQLLVKRFGVKAFDYIGNSTKDRAVWREADRSYLVTSARSGMPAWATDIEFVAVLRESGKPAWRVWLKELRIHQSLKNLLLFLPLIAAHAFGDTRSLLLVVGGFIAFTFMASSVYLLNDLLDLRSDRLHARKSQRPLAAGRILPLGALAVSAALAVIALVGSAFIGVEFTVVLVLYAILTCLYSFWLKRVTLVDVIVLAMLYMIRILAGAVITNIALSFWFTGVTLFLFISLALVKRFTELSRHIPTADEHRIPGRGYSASDSMVILPLGIGSGMAVLILLAIYLQSDAVATLYPSAAILWLVIPTMFYWIGNIWIQAGRGTIHDDPIIFALRNRASLISAGLVAVLFISASTTIAASAEKAFAWFTQR